MEKRASGILLHPTSLPGSFLCGDLGTSALKFIDWLTLHGQKLWQVLPLGPTDVCPYSGVSAFALNPLLISLEKLADDSSDLTKEEVDLAVHEFCEGENRSSSSAVFRHISFPSVRKAKRPLLQKAFANFVARGGLGRKDFVTFCEANSYWLPSYASFEVINQIVEQDVGHVQCWLEWPEKYRYFSPDLFTSLPQKEMNFQKYLQFETFRQWSELKSYAQQNDVTIVGDIAIYVDLHSADVWSHREVFDLDPTTLLPRFVSGVPPDYFSENGQLWGHPVYNWDYLSATGFEWWVERLRLTLKIVDVLRIDHFRGLESYWAVPYDHALSEKTARVGEWKKTPGKALFTKVFEEVFGSTRDTSLKPIEGLEGGGGTKRSARAEETLPAKRIRSIPLTGKTIFNPPIIVEDLGDVTDDVVDLRDFFNFPNMCVLQFAFGDISNEKTSGNVHLPYNHRPLSIVYPGTHDNSTAKGWWQKCSSQSRSHFALHAGCDSGRIFQDGGVSPVWSLLSLTLHSVARMAVIPLQDILELDDEEGRFNDPGKGDWEKNWRWGLCSLDAIPAAAALRLELLTKSSGR